MLSLPLARCRSRIAKRTSSWASVDNYARSANTYRSEIDDMIIPPPTTIGRDFCLSRNADSNCTIGAHLSRALFYRDRLIECQEIAWRRGWSNGGRRTSVQHRALLLFFFFLPFFSSLHPHAHVESPRDTFSSHHASIIIISVRSAFDRQ